MKNICIQLFIIVVLVIGLSSCQKEFQRVNTNPNNLEHADPTTLLSNILVQEFYNNAYIGWTLGNGIGQYMTFSQDYYNTATRYQPVTNEPYWDPMYEAARDANILYQQGQQLNNPFIQAVGLTLRSYAFAQLTECWGDIPLKQALQGESGLFTPAYDSQQVVYTDPTMGILPSLQRADSLLIIAKKGSISGDILYQADPVKWRKFVNALRLRYLIRISSKMNVAPSIQSIVQAGVLMADPTESASLSLPNTLPYNFPSLTERSGDYQVKFMNSTLYRVYAQTQDSFRMRIYFSPNALHAQETNFSFDHYGGMPLVVNATTDQINQASLFSAANFRSIGNPNVLKARIITYAEQQFALAEAALKGYISANAQSYYTSGVIGAFQELGLTVAQANSYLQNSSVIWNTNPDSALAQIITQKWILNINNGFEGWIEYRRTGYPAFDPGGSANLNGGLIPSRFLYPISESTINAKNYQAEIQKMGGKDNTNYKAWWER
ncbi:MAG: SusD/RagB family nutrient-binding outer membrane lipoprotein [Thermoflavifilum sp.]|nr:SusD/RagB family nutrient-binding outer membrane lipoprotein [Thermoflavifilum sp.]